MATRPYRDLTFGAYAPDFGGSPLDSDPAYLTDATGLRGTLNGYRPLPAFELVSGAAALATQISYGLATCYWDVADVVHFFVATAGGVLYESRNEGQAWQDVSPAAGGAISPDGDFVRFGDDVVLITPGRAHVKKSLTSTLATLFTSLGGSPPNAECGARIRQHLVLGNLTATDPFAIQTSAIGDHEDWPVPGTADALSKQAITESLNPEFGPIRRIVGGEKFGIIEQDFALTRMTYVGGSNVYEFDTYERTYGQGRSANSALVAYTRPSSEGNLWYGYNAVGVFVTDGYAVQYPSDGKLDEALFLNSISHPAGGVFNSASYTSAFEPKRSLLLLGGVTKTAGQTPYILVLNPDLGAFSIMSENPVCLFTGYSTTAGKIGKCAYNFDLNNKLTRLTGAAGSIALQTGYIELDPGYKTQITGAHLLGAGVPGSLSLAHKSTSLLSAVDVSQSGFTTMTANPRGMKAADRTTEQFHAFRVTGTGSESQLIKGIRVYFERGEPAT